MFKKNKKNKGFSIVELLVVISIFTVLTAVTVFNYGDFDKNITVTNLAYEIALTIREAQNFSLSVRGDDGSFDVSYGTSFLNSDDYDNKNFIFFIDKDNNDICQNDVSDSLTPPPGPYNSTELTCSYDNCSSDFECIRNNVLTRGIIIKRICTLSDAGIGPAMDSNGNCNDKESTILSLTFQRPDIDAIIHANDSLTPSTITNNWTEAAILLEAPSGTQRAVSIKNNGQISVDFINN